MDSISEVTQNRSDADGAADLRQIVKTVILLGLGGYFALNIVNGNLTNYINTRFAWLSYVAVVLFFVLGITSLIAYLRGDHRLPEDGMHGESRASWSIILVAAIPLLLGTLVPSEPLGADAVGSISTNSVAARSVGFVTKEPLDRDILDWTRLFASSELPASFDGQEAEIIGFVYHEPDFPDNHFMVARFTVSCCVADASALGLPVHVVDGNMPEVGVWVRVNGAFNAEDFRDEQMPVIQAVAIETIEQPDHPYLYP